MTAVLCAIFFLSGAAALLFETLWFRQAGLTFGNGVWAASLVLAGFMAGLALGNAGVARFGARIRRPVRFYALLEGLIAVTGVALVWWLPSLTQLLTPLLRPVLDQPWLVNPLRLAVGFLLLLIPSTAMGATLPLLVKALLARDPNFGSVLGRLYGWNTLGAVIGALAGEAALLEWLGVRGTAAAAASLNLLVAAVAVGLSGRFVPVSAQRCSAAPRMAINPAARRLLAASFLAGGTLLALEVVWFRFVQLFVNASSVVFSIMLAVVLAGIAAGSILSGAWLRRVPMASRHAPGLALLSGFLVVVLYQALAFYPFQPQYSVRWTQVVLLGAALMLPVCMLSGALFTLIGTSLNREISPPVRATGLLTFANTVGAGLGSLIAGFALLPLLGMESSLFGLAIVYSGVAWMAAGTDELRASLRRRLVLVVAVAYALSLFFFPFGLMQRRFLPESAGRFALATGSRLAAVREGRTETIVLLRRDFLGEPVDYSLLTNGHSMTTTNVLARRYMKLYVYWPQLFQPAPERALLLCYGLGSTAKALVETPSLEHIDVVDISREILELSELVHPDPAEDPLQDPRVRVHVEDGRYFLQTTRRRYDLITGEPPPPKNAGVVNLYTREYFQLVYDRLNEGGIHTYWLPAHILAERDVKAIVQAYCGVFQDCTLWAGTGLDWMLVGTRNARWGRSEEVFRRLWSDEVVGPQLRALGFEQPEQLGSIFIADADQLARLAGETPSLVDDFPKRLTNHAPHPASTWPVYQAWVDPRITRERFVASRFIRSAWPEELREGSLPYFEFQRILNDWTVSSFVLRGLRERTEDLHTVLTRSSLRTLALWKLGTSVRELQVLDRSPPEARREVNAVYRLALGALADRDWERAALLLRRVHVRDPHSPEVLRQRLYALCMAGNRDEAESVVRRVGHWLPLDGSDRDYWSWMHETFGLSDPYHR